MRDNENKNRSIYLPTATDSVRQCLIELTGLRGETLESIKKTTAMAYLDCYLPDTFPRNKAKWICYLEQSDVFWQWWGKLWQDRDLEFINVVDDMVLSNPIYFYQEKHNICCLMSRVRLPGRVLNACKIKTKN